MRGEYRLRQCAGFEQGETEDNGIGCKGEYRAVQIVRYYHVVYQNRVNADAYHNEEALKTDSEQGFEVVVSYLPPFPVRHCCKRDRRYRTVKCGKNPAPCHIAMAGFRELPSEPDLHLSAYPALQMSV